MIVKKMKNNNYEYEKMSKRRAIRDWCSIVISIIAIIISLIRIMLR